MACSGPGAAEAIARSWWIGWAALAGTAAGVGAVVIARRWVGAPWLSWGNAAAVALVPTHPGCWLLPIGGDCGAMRVSASLGWGVVSACVVVAVGAAAVIRRR